ncbi:N-alpha-acetyltransferase 80-like isoform X2 [Uranotaenia lowii]|uniref:N-alpha-acetyltransferase 80-like isoform X2 n=1 Tax=Uranotaenia lowii TaxID=190385 RepID=UPI002479742F|nr:N-alpha-acetyltransferase 80-like isoform X2 [Uranotaenia lowii]
MGRTASTDGRTRIVVPIHQHHDLLDQCVQLINSEWPRSYTARLWSLKASKDTLPTNFILIEPENTKDQSTNSSVPSKVLAHAKLSPIPADKNATFVESVVVDRQFRGQGLGRVLMREVETHCFQTLKLETIYLSTIDQEGFYTKLGYKLCKAINIFGTKLAINDSTKKIWMKKTFLDWKQEK